MDRIRLYEKDDTLQDAEKCKENPSKNLFSPKPVLHIQNKKDKSGKL
jgi:hypothetical protein